MYKLTEWRMGGWVFYRFHSTGQFVWVSKLYSHESLNDKNKRNIKSWERIPTNLFSGRSSQLVPREELHLTGGVIQHKTPIHWSLTRWWARLEISLKRGRFTRMVRSCGQQMLHFTKSWSPFHQQTKADRHFTRQTVNNSPPAAGAARQKPDKWSQETPCTRLW